jgi:ADP-ribose pyrophosphatase YjhB (NUDIX family)
MLPDNQIKYTIRVYMLILNPGREILLSDEYLLKMKMTKFPGGGMEYGEGTIDCLRREAIEEFGQEITHIRHFYTTDFYQKALFFDDHQLISIYYLVDLEKPEALKTSTRPFDFQELKNGAQSFRWASLETIRDEDLTFPIDRKVLGLIRDHLT